MVEQIPWEARHVKKVGSESVTVEFRDEDFQRGVFILESSDPQLGPSQIGQNPISFRDQQLPISITLIHPDGREGFIIIDSDFLGEHILVIPNFPTDEPPPEEEPPPDDEPPPESPQERIPFWLNLGFTEDEAVAILIWQIENQQSPDVEAMREILRNEFIDINEDDQMVMTRLAELSPEERAELLEAEDISEDEKGWLNNFNQWLEDHTPEELQKNISSKKFRFETAIGAAAGSAAATLLGTTSLGKLGVFRGFMTKGKSAMKWGFGVGAAWKTVGGTLKRTTTIGSVLTSPLAKGATALAGVDGIMVWLASDNILGGATFLTNKLKGAVKGRIVETQQEIDDALGSIETWMNTASSLVEISSNINPFLRPFKDVLIANRDLTFASFELTKEEIQKEFDKIQGGN